MSKRDYYEVLGISKDESDKEIKKAYRKRAMKFHPDRNSDDPEAEKKFKEASEAYEVLSDDQKRQRYDQFGHQGVNGGRGGAGFQDMGFEDIFSHFSDIFVGDPFGGGGRQSRRRNSPGSPGADMKLRIELSLEEIAFGTTKKLKVKKQIKCDSCDGTGAETKSDFQTSGTCNGTGQVRQVRKTMLRQMVNVQPCPECDGEGRIITNKCSKCYGEGRYRGKETVEVNVPSGVSEGNYITMRGQGNAGKRGGDAGDLVVLIEEQEHEHFERDGNDIYYDLVLSVPDAILGTEVKVPTLKGQAKIKVDEGIQPGKLLRMKEKGIHGLKRSGIGDQYVRINVYIPKNLSGDEHEKIEALRGSEHFAASNKKDNSKGFFS